MSVTTQTQTTGTVSMSLGTAKLIQGPKGPKGDKGDSAFVLAQQGGYEGTEGQFATAMAALPEQAEDAKENAEAAVASAVEAAEIAAAALDSKDASEAWAKGTIDGVPVPSTHEAFENNAKYYMTRAKTIVGGDYISRDEAGTIISSMFAPIQATATTAQKKADSAAETAAAAQDTADTAATAVTTHAANTEIHVTETDKSRWNAGGISPYATGELEDTAIEIGTFTNAGAGWNSFRFREAFEAVPVVVVQAENFPGRVAIKNVTKEGFMYCLRKAVYTQGTVTTGEYFTANQSGTTSHTKNSLVSAVTLPTFTEETTDEAIRVNYIAIEYGGDR